MTEPSLRDETLWIRKDIADLCQVSEEAVRKWERAGEGPPRAQIPGRLVRYREEDVKAWLDQRARAAVRPNGTSSAAAIGARSARARTARKSGRAAS